MVRRSSVGALALVVASSSSGCCAVVGRLHAAVWSGPGPRYGPGTFFIGVRLQAQLVADSPNVPRAVLCGLVLLVDLPLSLALDLVLAPFELDEFLEYERRADRPATVAPVSSR